MISQKTIKSAKLDADSLKAFFTAKKPSDDFKRLQSVIRSRIFDGRTNSLKDYRVWRAVDAAYDVPFSQVTPTMIRHITENAKSTAEVMEALKLWGVPLQEMFSEKESKDGVTKWELNVPLFMKVFLPFVRAYFTVRMATIFNDRNLTPLFTYSSRVQTSKNRVLCEVATQIVESVATSYGYSAVLRDFIFNALMYSVSIMFPMESWEKRKSGVGSDEVVVREGVRYVVPHVTRTFYDMGHPLRTINTGTGCSYAGYWTIVKYGDVANNEAYWNSDKITYGYDWMGDSKFNHYFREAYPCVMQMPQVANDSKTDRETLVARYTQSDVDKAVFLTYIFMEIKPSDYGISDYSNPVWMRFTVGADDTILFAEVFPYRPLNMACYDTDSGRGLNASLALEIIPFQDLIGNCLTNYLLTIKRNLSNIVFYDTDIVDAAQLGALNSRSNQQYAGINLVGYSGVKMERQSKSVAGLFNEIKFAYADSTAVMQSINTVISLLERLLVVSAQEIGSAASHQQSKKEVEIISSNTSNRVAYTSSFIDEGIDAWRRQIWEAIASNMDGKEVLATIPSDIPELESALKELGFAMEGQPFRGEVTVKGKIDGSKFLNIASRRSESNRQNDSAAASSMFQAIASLSSNPLVAQIVDPETVAEMIEIASRLAGADEDFSVKLKQDGVMSSQLKDLIGQIQQQFMAMVKQEVSDPAAKAIGQQGQQIDAIMQQLQQIEAALSQPPQSPETPPVTPSAGPPGSPIMEPVPQPTPMTGPPVEPAPVP